MSASNAPAQPKPAKAKAGRSKAKDATSEPILPTEAVPAPTQTQSHANVPTDAHRAPLPLVRNGWDQQWDVDLANPQQYALCMTTDRIRALINIFEILRVPLTDLVLYFTSDTMVIFQYDAHQTILVQFSMRQVAIHCPQTITARFAIRQMLQYLKKIKDDEATVSFVMRNPNDPTLRLHVRKDKMSRDFDVSLIPDMDSVPKEFEDTFYGKLCIPTRKFNAHIHDADGTGDLVYMYYDSHRYSIVAKDPNTGGQVRIFESLDFEDMAVANSRNASATGSTAVAAAKALAEEEDDEDGDSGDDEAENGPSKKRKAETQLALPGKKSKKTESSSGPGGSDGTARLTVTAEDHRTLATASDPTGAGSSNKRGWPLVERSYPARYMQAIAKGGQTLADTMVIRMSPNGPLSLVYDIPDMGSLRFILCHYIGNPDDPTSARNN